MYRLFTMAGLALLGAACSAIVTADEQQCETTADCTDRGFENAECLQQVCVESAAAVDPVWGCLGNVVEPEPDPSKTLAFPIQLVFAIDNAALATDAVIDICDKLDIECTGSDGTFLKGLNPDSNGTVNVQVPEGFDGFVRIQHPDIVESRVYVGRPLVEPPSVEAIQLFRPSEYMGLATAIAGTAPDPERGTAIVFSADCAGEAVGGVRFDTPSADAASQEFYLVNQSPTKVPVATETDNDGFGGYFNVQAGATVVRAFRAEDDAYIGESGFQVRPGELSYVLVAPTPQAP